MATKMKTILVINSELSMQEIIEAYISDTHGWRILKAASSLDGLDCAAQNKPDAILFDFSTFGMNFFAFLKRLRLQQENKNTPVILLAEKKWLDKELLQAFQIEGVIDYKTDTANIPQQIAQILNWDKVSRISDDEVLG